MSRKVYAAKLAVVEHDRVITILSVGPFPNWTRLLNVFLKDYEEQPTHQWSVLVDASTEGKGKSSEPDKEQAVLWAPLFYKGVVELVTQASEGPQDTSTQTTEPAELSS
jgi:hypothetical protein